MIFTTQTIGQQIERFIKEYPSLAVIHKDATMLNIRGELLVNLSHNNFSVYKEYLVEIQIPINSEKLPMVVDAGNNISKDYRHRYKSGKLCLETDTRIKLFFADGFDLVVWVKKFVEPYFFSYEYYKYCGEFPFGERLHNCEGIVQTYQDIFETKDLNSALRIMQRICLNVYRGHEICPCGSGKRIRNCHGYMMRPFYEDERRKKILFDDMKIILEEINVRNNNKEN